jgi:hypothetical protein
MHMQRLPLFLGSHSCTITKQRISLAPEWCDEFPITWLLAPADLLETRHRLVLHPLNEEACATIHHNSNSPIPNGGASPESGLAALRAQAEALKMNSMLLTLVVTRPDNWTVEINQAQQNWIRADCGKFLLAGSLTNVEIFTVEGWATLEQRVEDSDLVG